MPIRLRSALTTFATALTIPVNIYVSSEQEIVAQADVVQVAELRGVGQVFDPDAPQRAGCLAATDKARGDIRVDLVYKACREERGMDLGAALDEKAEHSALPQLVEQRQERDAAVRGGQ